MSNHQNMKFPVICFKKNNNMIYYFERESDLLTTTEKLLSKKIFNGFHFVDINGCSYKVLSIRKIGLKGFFGINPLLKGWWKDREIKVEMKFEPNADKIELKFLKQMLLEKIEKSKKNWEEAWEISELIEMINETKTFKELIVLFK